MKDLTVQDLKVNARAARANDKALLEELARKASGGDGNALLALCQMSAKSVLFRVMRLIPDKMDAEDTAQEILMRVCESIRELKEPKAFGGWINSIIVNEINRFLAKSNKYNAVTQNIDDYFDVMYEENEDFLPFEYAIREENRVTIMKIVDRLPKRQLEAVMLHYYEGMSMSEAASAMRMSVQGVSRYLMLARGRIKKELERLEVSDKTARCLAFLPLGQLLERVLGEQAGRLPITDSVWLEQVMNDCAKTVASTTANGLSVASVVAKVSIPLIKPAVLAASFLTVVVATGGIWYGFGPGKAPPEPAPVVQEVTGSVVFNGGESGFEHLNPKDATVTTNMESGEITIAGWAITAPDSDIIVSSGEDAEVGKALTEMLTTEADGEYLLTFSLMDSSGREYKLSRSFYIMTANS